MVRERAHYEYFFTEYFGLTREDYRGKSVSWTLVAGRWEAWSGQILISRELGGAIGRHGGSMNRDVPRSAKKRVADSRSCAKAPTRSNGRPGFTVASLLPERGAERWDEMCS